MDYSGSSLGYPEYHSRDDHLHNAFQKADWVGADSKYQLLEGPVKKHARQSLIRVFNAMESITRKKRDHLPMIVDKALLRDIEATFSLLKNNRQLRTDLARLVTKSHTEGMPIQQAIQEYFKQPHRYEKLKGLGKAGLYIISSTIIFLYTAKFFAARGLVSSIESTIGSYLPTMPGTEFVVVNAAFFTSLALYFLPLMTLLSLLPCCNKTPTDELDPADGQAAIEIPDIAITDQIELVPVAQPTYQATPPERIVETEKHGLHLL